MPAVEHLAERDGLPTVAVGEVTYLRAHDHRLLKPWPRHGASSRRRHRSGGTYYRKKIAEGKSRKEALRCLKRRVCDAVFRTLLADSLAPSSSAA